MYKILILFTILILFNCSDPASSSGPKVTIDDVSISYTDDMDSDGYYSTANLYFDVDISRGSIDVIVVIAYEGTGDAEPQLYFFSSATTIEGTDDQTFYVELDDDFWHDSYDFTIYVVDADDIEDPDVTPLAIATKTNYAELGGVLLEKLSEDALPYDLTFNNNTYTPIDMSVTGLVSHVIPAKSSYTFQYSNNPGSIDIYGTTSGETNTGTQIGLLMTFSSYGFVTAGLNSSEIDLNITSTYYFQRIQNSSIYYINGPVYVNYGTADQTVDYIQIPNDGVLYNTGYYKALLANEVRAYVNPTDYVYWNSLSYPGVDNQAMNLTFSGGKMKNGPAIASHIQSEMPTPALIQSTIAQKNADFKISGIPVDRAIEKPLEPGKLKENKDSDKLKQLFK